MTDLQNHHIIYDYEFQSLEDRIQSINEQIENDDIDDFETEHRTSYSSFLQIDNSLESLVKFVQHFVDVSEPTDFGDYIISFNRADLKSRIDALCKMSLRYKQNTSLLDLDPLNNRVIKTEIFHKTTLTEFLNERNEDYRISGH